MSRRDDLAAALSAIAGIDAKSYPPDTAHPGECWPMWQRTTWLTDCSHEETWQILVVLPAGAPAATAEASDALLDPIFEALSDVGAYIDAAEPAFMTGQDGGAPIPLLRVTARISN
jgi:hypothetical protein